MKKFTKVLFQILIGLVLLGIGIKLLGHFFSRMEEEDSEHREPYQPED